jgi:hypothetical protein
MGAERCNNPADYCRLTKPASQPGRVVKAESEQEEENW